MKHLQYSMLMTAKSYVTTVLCLQHTIFIEACMLQGRLNGPDKICGCIIELWSMQEGWVSSETNFLGKHNLECVSFSHYSL